MYWNRLDWEYDGGQLGWIVTLDVLKFDFVIAVVASPVCWIVTLDVLKYSK